MPPLVWLLCLVSLAASAQAPPQAHAATGASPGAETISPEAEITPVPVKIDGRTIFSIRTNVGGYSSSDRAENIQDRILKFADDRQIPIDSVHVEEREAWSEILTGSAPLMVVTEQDAKAVGRARNEAAAEAAEIIRRAVQRYRDTHTWRNFTRGTLLTLAATLVLAGLLWVLWRVRRAIHRRVERWIEERKSRPEMSSKTRISLIYLAKPLLTLGAFVRWAVVLALLQTYLTVTLHFFPQTEQLSMDTTNWLFSQLSDLTKGIVEYLPNLLLVIIISVITFYILRANTLIFNEIESGDLEIAHFYPDWARPTANLVRLLVLVLAAIVIFPYLPGSKSPAFQGISIFLGVLLSLGSSSAVANAVAGTILNYARSFQVGDVVTIGDIYGEVTEKSILVTRIRTPKKEIISIPNGTVMGIAVKNYSAEARTTGVIFHTTITIGYDAPWRTVHELLINAALATEYVLQEPRPFVLQTSLDDFYVSYELNAYTRTPERRAGIYSDLHQNIQDKFNEAGVEINSPHYGALRDGNSTTIPQNYLPKEYEAPGFRVENIRNRKDDAIRKDGK